jgi:short-subunit dehydrogenase
MGNMVGKLCSITGSTAGIGLCTSLEIARMGGSVIMIGRNPSKCMNAVKMIQEDTGNRVNRATSYITTHNNATDLMIQV